MTKDETRDRARAGTGHEEVEGRIRVVVEHIVMYGWSPTSQAKLAEKLGCSEKTIHRARLAAEQRIANHRAKAPEPSRADFLGRLRAMVERAGDAEDLKAVATLMGLEARVSGLEQAPTGQGDGIQVVINAAPCAPPEPPADSE